MVEIDKYVERVFQDIPESNQKVEMMNEIKDRLNDATEEWIEMGKEREDAINKAIVDFGSMDEILLGLRETSNGDVKKYNKNTLMFSIFGSMILIAMSLFINFYYTPNTIWFIYPTFAILWWPLSLYFFGNWRKGRE